MVVGNKDYINRQPVKVVVNGVQLTQVRNFTYLGSTVTDVGTSEKEIRIRMGRAISAHTKMDIIWKAKNVEIKNIFLLMKSVVMTTL